MLKDSKILRIPGPSPIPPSVQQAMSQPMIGHRGAEAEQLIKGIKPRLKKVFGTKQDVFIITGSGTSGLEAAVVNAVSAGDEVLVIVSGSFGERFVQICEAHQVVVHRFEVPLGEAVNPKDVQQFLSEHEQIKAVFATYCETSTAVINPVDKISKIVHDHSEALMIVDGVSCVGGIETKMDKWGIDIFITGSQKAMMLPAGLNFVAVSDRAWQVIEKNDHSRFYLDLRKYRDSLQANSTPFTPGLSLIFGLDQVLTLMEEEGLAEVYSRHQLMKEMVREAMRALDIPLLTNDEVASPTVTAIRPDDFDGEELRKQVREDFNLDLAGGQHALKGKIVRIGHMGYCTPADVLQMISLIEVGLQRIGKAIQPGAGVARAQEIFIQKQS